MKSSEEMKENRMPDTGTQPGLPEDFCKETERLLGEDGFRLLAEALQTEAPASIRLNTPKLEANGMTAGAPGSTSLLNPQRAGGQVPWCGDGFYLKERPPFTFDPLFHAGCYYVQEASSMFLEQIVKQCATEPGIALDLCAAPGGKSTHLRALLPEGSLLVSNEIVPQRAQILKENLIKWGHKNTIVTQNAPADFRHFRGMFGLIVADAPCSGEGMFRKDPKAIEEWSSDNVRLCSARQREIIRDIWDCLRPGGIFVYSTCTFNAAENEDNVAWMQATFGAEPLDIRIPDGWNIARDLTGRRMPAFRFLPHLAKGEGFFACALRKPGEDGGSVPSKQKKQKGKNAPNVPTALQNWLRDAEQYTLRRAQDLWTAIPKEWELAFDSLQARLRILHAGVPLATEKGKDLIPAHALAMSNERQHDAFPACEVDYPAAIAYLRHEAVTLPQGTPKGYVLVTYRGIPLGFAKNIGNRANNLYPNEWRILSAFIPEEAPGILA